LGKKWVEKMLAHMFGGSEADIEDAAQWLRYYLGKRHDVSFTLACDSLGIPLVEQMDDSGAEAMWAQANVNITQQRIIKRHLRHHFGKRVFIPEKKLSFDSEYYKVPIFFGEYKYYKDNDTSQKAEKCNYWCRDSTLVVSKELECLVDYTNDLDVINRFSSISSATNGGIRGTGTSALR
jgi:predicted nuclease of restriction endonuclease-like RecB superfamily